MKRAHTLAAGIGLAIALVLGTVAVGALTVGAADVREDRDPEVSLSGSGDITDEGSYDLARLQFELTAETAADDPVLELDVPDGAEIWSVNGIGNARGQVEYDEEAGRVHLPNVEAGESAAVSIKSYSEDAGEYEFAAEALVEGEVRDVASADLAVYDLAVGAGAGEVYAGEEATIEANVSGMAGVDDPELWLNVPDDTEFVSADGPGEGELFGADEGRTNSAEYRWAFSGFETNDTREVEMTVRADEPIERDIARYSTASAVVDGELAEYNHSILHVRPERPDTALALETSQGPSYEDVEAGEQAWIEFEVRGGERVAEPEVDVELDEDLKLLDERSYDGTFHEDEVRWAFHEVDLGEYRDGRLYVTADRAGEYEFSADAIADGEVVDETSGTVSFEPNSSTPAPEDALSIDATGDTVEVGEEATVTVALSSLADVVGPEADVAVADGLEVVDVSAKAQYDGDLDRWRYVTIDQGETLAAELTVVADEPGEYEVGTDALVRGDPVESANATVNVREEGTVPDEALSVDVSVPEHYERGEGAITFEVSATEDVADATVTAELTEDLQILDVGGDGTFDEDAREWELTQLTAGETASTEVTVWNRDRGDIPVGATAAVDGNPVDASASVLRTGPNAPPQERLSAAAGAGEAVVGEETTVILELRGETDVGSPAMVVEMPENLQVVDVDADGTFHEEELWWRGTSVDARETIFAELTVIPEEPGDHEIEATAVWLPPTGDIEDGVPADNASASVPADDSSAMLTVTEDDGGELDYPAWDERVMYFTGDRVVHDGDAWEASSWTRGDEPGASRESPWERIEDESAGGDDWSEGEYPAVGHVPLVRAR
ncbi:carbohydrate-binding protein [Halovivax limisalsi]|uniref:carbohydrate-binding protein n=1 Tax=Halovivax limisalsi TaxID=1453760 RepID=UPI001FFCE440|nr:carbohydrate-binding protein [Halovivax limisalsi]